MTRKKCSYRKIAGLLCAVLTLFSSSMCVSAQAITANPERSISVSPRYTNTSSISANLTINGNLASLSGKIVPKDSMYTEVTCNLQKRESNGSWTTIYSCSDTSNSRLGAVVSDSYYVVSGNSYRAYVTGRAGSEYVSCTSQIVYCN